MGESGRMAFSYIGFFSPRALGLWIMSCMAISHSFLYLNSIHGEIDYEVYSREIVIKWCGFIAR